MKKTNIDETELTELLKELKPEKADKGFSKRMTEVILDAYSNNVVKSSLFEKYFGKFVLFILVCFNMLLFYDLIASSTNTLLLVCAIAFVVGVWILIVFLKRFGNPSLLSMDFGHDV
ncbi:hypothetical protein [Flagellimonas algicola]|uniref:Uncharacterized protein n=1 Tax=Flagellimonas algicola TaxID=2583815 RepID=A0ABY2WRK7_9FLAO|nr:hypothetical protein [Allomuricauda algicola]TMU57352.1 hypothetical protein FGG15_07355 [Allomuricauda algicola]